MKRQIYVVEGKNDVAKLKQVFSDINAVSINGSEIDLEVIKYLETLKDTHEIILVLDPDYMGLQIRKSLEQHFPKAKHIFVERKSAFSKNRKKIGLEHLSVDAIKLLFKNIYTKNEYLNNIKLSDLYELKLIGYENSKNLRKQITDYFNLGYCNGKTLLKRLNESNIKIADIKKISEV